MKRTRFAGVLLTLLVATGARAQGPNGTGTYYASAEGQKGKALKTALCAIISTGTRDLGYNALWEAYEKTDLRADGTIWDMYSNVTKYNPKRDRAGNYKKEGDVYNREHTVPQSWFKKQSPMRSDLFQVYPTDGYVNNKRGHMPFGENNGESYQSHGGYSKVGHCTTEGYQGLVFEPANEYKGDLARTYFYMATRYENQISGWGGGVFGNGTYPGMANWTLKMLIRWAKNDPVSEKEIKRNNEVYKLQHNRNPFIDYPGLEQFIWGDSIAIAFDYDGNHTQPVVPTPNPNPNPKPNPGPDEPVTPPAGTLTFHQVTSTADLKVGDAYLIVSKTENKAMSKAAGKYRTLATIAIKDNAITTETGTAGKPYTLTLGGTEGAYTLYDAVDKKYLAYTGPKNALNEADNANTKSAQWAITFTAAGDVEIKNAQAQDRAIFYNSSSPRFGCYLISNPQTAITLYVKSASTGVITHETTDETLVNVYGIDGCSVRRQVKKADAMKDLPKGIYIMGGKKYVVQ